MNNLKNVYQTIKYRSSEFKSNGAEWKKELSSAKNYVPTPDFKHWAFAKSSGFDNEYFNGGGGAAKKWFYNRGFINILSLKDSEFKSKVIKHFIVWTKDITSFDIAKKFEKDQSKNKRFELLVPIVSIPKKDLSKNFIKSNQKYYDDGFLKEIQREIGLRNSKLREDAKAHYGLKCSVCKFDFGKTYGNHGFGFIEIHHLIPIADGARKYQIEDVRPVCSNCHRMLHRGASMLEIDELKEIIAKAKIIK